MKNITIINLKSNESTLGNKKYNKDMNFITTLRDIVLELNNNSDNVKIYIYLVDDILFVTNKCKNFTRKGFTINNVEIMTSYKWGSIKNISTIKILKEIIRSLYYLMYEYVKAFIPECPNMREELVNSIFKCTGIIILDPPKNEELKIVFEKPIKIEDESNIVTEKMQELATFEDNIKFKMNLLTDEMCEKAIENFCKGVSRSCKFLDDFYDL